MFEALSSRLIDDGRHVCCCPLGYGELRPQCVEGVKPASPDYDFHLYRLVTILSMTSSTDLMATFAKRHKDRGRQEGVGDRAECAHSSDCL